MSDFYTRYTNVETNENGTLVKFMAYLSADLQFTVAAMPAHPLEANKVYVTAYVSYLLPNHAWTALDGCGYLVEFRDMADTMEEMWNEASRLIGQAVHGAQA